VTDARTPWKHEVLAKPVWESGSAREVWSALVAKSAGCLCLLSALYSTPSPVRFKNKNVQFLQTKMEYKYGGMFSCRKNRRFFRHSVKKNPLKQLFLTEAGEKKLG
jgi:hypothetical protein